MLVCFLLIVCHHLLQCWAKVPTDRPTFQALRDFFSETLPPMMKATQKFDEADKLRVEPGDNIIVIDGRYYHITVVCIITGYTCSFCFSLTFSLFLLVFMTFFLLLSVIVVILNLSQLKISSLELDFLLSVFTV